MHVCRLCLCVPVCVCVGVCVYFFCTPVSSKICNNYVAHTQATAHRKWRA